MCPDCNLVNIADLLLRPCSTSYVCLKASVREGGEGHCCKDVPEGQFCNADRAGAKLKFFFFTYSPYRAGPNEPDTSPTGWSPHNEGCERFRLIAGADEIALNAEMGL